MTKKLKWAKIISIVLCISLFISNFRVMAVDEINVSVSEENTQSAETQPQNISDDFERVYSEGKIHIYNLSQLKAIGTNQKLKDKDSEEETFGLGNYVVDENEQVTYALDGDYVLENDIPLDCERWNLPEGFTGTFTSKDNQIKNQLYDEQRDIIYIYNSYQLDLLVNNQSEDSQSPVLSLDYDVNQFGKGKLVYKQNGGEYLTYSQNHNYVLSKYFTSKRPANEVLVEQKEREEKKVTYASSNWENTDLSGRDYYGQVYKEINGKKYILIGNRQQLKAIGSDKSVTPTLFLYKNPLIGEEKYTPLYPGDADFGKDVTYGGEKFKYFDKNPIPNELMHINYNKGLIGAVGDILGGILGNLLGGSEVVGYNNETGEPDKSITERDIKHIYKDLKYSKDADYIIFRDIDLQNVDWTPLMFSGTMLGAKADTQGNLWDANGIITTNKPVISNINVNQTKPIDTTKQSGIGFFGSIMSTSKKQIGVSDQEVLVKNIKLQNISVQNNAEKIKDNRGLIGGLLDILGTILGTLLGNLGEALDNLLNPDKNSDPTVFATGTFAGRISGDVSIEDCEVENVGKLSNVHDYVGGFAGYIEGVTEYGKLQETLGLVVKVLEEVLNVLPFIDLGTLIHVLLDGNIIQLDSLIPTGYKNPEITNCHVIHNGTLSIGNAKQNYVGGFAGKMVGTVVKTSSVQVSDLSLNGKNMVGGFSGFTANAELVGLLDNLGVDLIQSIRLNSFILGCEVKTDTLQITASEKYGGGMTGALANSFLVDNTITGSTRIKANKFSGGMSGIATLGQAISLGEFYTGKKDLVSLISKILSGTLTGDEENALLSLTGVSPSVLAGNEINGLLSVNAVEDYAGGLVGQGDGVKIISSSELSEKSFIWKKVLPILNYTVKNRKNTVTNLNEVKGKNFVGGIIGEARTASAAGLLNKVLGIGNFLKFEIGDTQVTNSSSGASITAVNDYAGGMAGRAIGGDISNINITELKEVTAQNYAGGFIGHGGTGSLAETGALNILGLIKVSNLLSLADGIVLKVNNANVGGIQTGLVVSCTGSHSVESDKTQYYAGGFIGKSTSVHISDANVMNLRKVTADTKFGYAGGFSGKNETGGLADAAGEDTEVLKLLGINGLLNAIPYLVSDFEKVTVKFISQNEPQVKAGYAGGFIGEMQSGKIDNSKLTEPYAVYGAEYIQGEYYAGGFAGKMYSGGLASANGLSVLNGVLNVNLSNLLNVLNVYIPSVKYAGVSSDGLVVETISMDEIDLHSGSAGGYVGYGSGVKISHSDVKQLKFTEAAQSRYAVSGVSNAGGYVGKLDIGSSASLGDGLKALGILQLTQLTQALDVVASEIEHSNVYGAVGGFSVRADGKKGNSDVIGNAGGFSGAIYGSQLQNSNVYNFNCIIGQETAGGYVGNFQPGNVASVIGETEVLGGLLTTSGNVLSVLQSFIPMIYNSETTATPCGSTVRAEGESDSTRPRGLAGGYVGYNLGGRIEGNSDREWNGKKPAVKRENAVIRLRSVYGYEFAGGFSGRVESANVADTGSISILYGLIKLSNPFEALSAVYPTETTTAVYGPLRKLDVETWNKWVDAVGVNGSYGQQFQNLGKVDNQQQLDEIIQKYAYGYDVKAGRKEAGTLSTQGGAAGGYAGRMDGGVITSAHTLDVKDVLAFRSSGGFVGEMMSAGVANVGGLELAGLDVTGSIPVLETFVPVIQTSSSTGYRSGATIIAEGTDTANGQGNAGGFAGIVVGGQIKGSESQFCAISNLKKVKGTNTVGGFAGSILTGSAAKVNVGSNDGLLSKVLGVLLGDARNLAKILNATVSTVSYAKVESWDDWGIVIDGTYKQGNAPQTQYAYAAGGFVGNTSGSVFGDKDKNIESLIVKNVRSVTGGEYVGGFFGLGDVSAVAQVGENQSDSILGLIGLGELDVLDAFRTYVYHASVQGSIVQGLTVEAKEETEMGTLNSKVYSGNAGGFGGSLYNGSVKDSKVTGLNTVTALNYSGGFIGHLGKSGTVDLDKVQTDNGLSGLLNATAGVMDNFGSHIERCTSEGFADGYIVSGQNGSEPIAGGFTGYADLAKIDESHAKNLKKVLSDQIAGGFAGKTDFSYLADIDAGSKTLLNPVLLIVNKLLDILYIDDLENLGAIEIDLGFIKLKVLSDGDVLSVNLLGLKISVALVKNNGDGTSDVAQVHIGDSYIEIPCTSDKGNHIKDTENIKIGLIKSNRTKIENSTVTGIAAGYDVFGGGASDDKDGTHEKGMSGGFIGFNNEGLLEKNDMYYADTIRGSHNQVGAFTGKTSLESVYEFNTIKNIEGAGNNYRIYREKNEFTSLFDQGGSLIATADENSEKWNEFLIRHIISVEKYDDLKGADVSNGKEKKEADVYISDSKAVLMSDRKVADNVGTTTPPPSDMQDPCDEMIHLTINKIWKDLNNLEGIRPDKITVRLSRTYVVNGEKKTDTDFNPVIEITPSNEKNVWQYIVKDLPAYKILDDGTHAYYTYELSEDPIKDYDTKIEISDDGYTITITNTHIPFLANTGGAGTLLFTVIGLLGITLVLLSFKRRRENEKSN